MIAPDISQTYPKKSLTLDTRFIVGEANGKDLSSDANHATLYTGRAFAFDGTGDYLHGGSVAAHVFTGSFSVTMWAKTASGTEQDFVYRFAGGATGFKITLRGDQNPAYWELSIADDAGWQHSKAAEGDTNIPAALDDGVWRHITLRANNGTLETYVNGVIGGTTDTYNNSVAIGGSGHRMTIGGSYAGTPGHIVTGSMAQLKVWNIALSAAQILEQTNNPEQVLPTGAVAANLISHWPLTDYQNTTANSMNALYFQDLGTAKSNALAYNGGMDAAEPLPCPQLGLMPSTSRVFFDGADDVYSIAADSDINGLFDSGGSVSMWLFANTVGETAGRPLYGKDAYYCYINNASGTTCDFDFVHYGSTTTGNWGSSARSFNLGVWNHVVITYNNSSTSNDPVIYINGSAISLTESAATDSPDDDTDIKYIGSSDTAHRTWDGYISEVAMWKAILDADAVTVAYNAGVQGFDLSADSGNYDNSGDLKGWWKMDNAFTVQDLTSYNNDATAAGSPVLSTMPEGTTAGTTLFGNTDEKRADSAVINLNGKEYVSIAHDVNLNPDMSEGFTVSVWAKMRNLTNGASTPILDKDTSNDRWYLRIRDDSGDAIQFNFGDGSGNTDAGYGNLTDNNWHHYVFVLNTSGSAWTTARMYKDGAHIAGADKDISARSADTPGTDALTIGSTGTAAQWDGAVAYPKIYARSLSENEAKLLYSSGLRVVRGL